MEERQLERLSVCMCAFCECDGVLSGNTTPGYHVLCNSSVILCDQTDTALGVAYLGKSKYFPLGQYTNARNTNIRNYC